jgi:FAD/FMN-containing dehydrogenase
MVIAPARWCCCRCDADADASTAAALGTVGRMSRLLTALCLFLAGAAFAPTPATAASAPGKPPAAERVAYYRAAWDAGQRAVLAAGGALSHHHGVGLNRGRFVADALGSGFGVLQQVKDALDPNGILNPGKLGLASPNGPVPWP